MQKAHNKGVTFINALLNELSQIKILLLHMIVFHTVSQAIQRRYHPCNRYTNQIVGFYQNSKHCIEVKAKIVEHEFFK
jgi:hypothetical protein